MQTSERIANALDAVLPPSARGHLSVRQAADQDAELLLLGSRIRARWLPRGLPHQVREAMQRQPLPDLLVAPSFSPGAQLEMRAAQVGWVDEHGGADFLFDNVFVSKTGAPPTPRKAGWTAATLGVCEALLLGHRATTRALSTATGAAPSTVALALSFLSDRALLDFQAVRGRNSGRTVRDRRELLDAYAEAVDAHGSSPGLRVGVLWRDPLRGMREIGDLWTQRQIGWAVTGAIAAAELAPFQTEIAPLLVYVDVTTVAQLTAVAGDIGLEPMEGGRLELRPFPSPITKRLCGALKASCTRSPGHGSMPTCARLAFAAREPLITSPRSCCAMTDERSLEARAAAERALVRVVASLRRQAGVRVARWSGARAALRSCSCTPRGNNGR